MVLAQRASADATVREAPSTRSGAVGGALYLFAGHSGWDAEALDARLAQSGYEPLRQDPGGGGFGLRFWHDPSGWMGGLEFQLALSNESVDQGRQLSLSSGQLTFQFGRTLYARRHLRTYAMLGAGVGAASLVVDPLGLPPRAHNPLGFADGSSGIQSYSVALQTLVGLDYLVPLGGSKRGFRALLFGLRAGYNVQPIVSAWATVSAPGTATHTVDLPRAPSDGAFVHLVIGDAI